MTYNDEEKIPAAPTLARITHRPLILDDFRDIPAGTSVKMWFKHFQEGELWWRYTRTDAQGLVGQIQLAKGGWSHEDVYFGEHENVLCIDSGSARDPLWSCPPSRWSQGAWSDDEEANDEGDGSDASER
jgi:hypothetical protein